MADCGQLWAEVAATVKLVPFQQCDHKFLLVKTANSHIFSTVNYKYKFFSAAGCIPNFGSSCKLQTLYMNPIKEHVDIFCKQQNLEGFCWLGENLKYQV